MRSPPFCKKGFPFRLVDPALSLVSKDYRQLSTLLEIATTAEVLEIPNRMTPSARNWNDVIQVRLLLDIHTAGGAAIALPRLQSDQVPLGYRKYAISQDPCPTPRGALHVPRIPRKPFLHAGTLASLTSGPSRTTGPPVEG